MNLSWLHVIEIGAGREAQRRGFLPLLASLDYLDGRMRWANSSEIAKGVFWAVRGAKQIGEGTQVIFLTTARACVSGTIRLARTAPVPCDLVVSQGGSGIMLGALSHGLPQLIIPEGADQFMNADACRDTGAVLLLARAEVSADAIATAVDRLLTEPAFTAAARAVQSQIDAMPDTEDVLAALIAKKATSPVGAAPELGK